MKLLRNLSGLTKIFKYQNFLGVPDEAPRDGDSPADDRPPEGFLSADAWSPDDFLPADERGPGDFLLARDRPRDGLPPADAGVPYITFGDEDFFKDKGPRAPAGSGETAESEEAGDPDAPDIEERDLFKKKIETNEAWEEAETIREEAREEAEAARAQAAREAEATREAARAEADRIVKEAEERAKKMEADAKEEGRASGYKNGLEEGRRTGKEQEREAVNEKYKQFFDAVNEARGGLEKQKQEALSRHLDDLGELTLTIAEKIVQVSLASSSEVIRRMIAFAAAPASEKQWAKVTISKEDAERLKKDKVSIRQTLREISERIELIVAADAPPGTCLVEFPDQVVDAGAGTQLNNMKEMIQKSAKEQGAAF